MLELMTPAAMARVDQRAVARGVSIRQLMDAAGHAVADAVATRHAFGVRILVLAGPGDNGGDAAVAALVLDRRGYAVALVRVGEARQGSAAEAAFRQAAHLQITAQEALSPAARNGLACADVVIDGLFGAGLSRPVEGVAADLINALNGSAARIYAIDLPSGVDGATGAVTGPAVMADETITFHRRKIGHALHPGRTHAGRVRVAEIGLREADIRAEAGSVFANEPDLWRGAVPVLGLAGHKYDRGHAVVVSGSASATGAARLAAAAALRGGAGLVTVASPADALIVNACHLTAVMVAQTDGPDGLASLLADRRRNVVCLGPGLPPDETTVALVGTALASPAAAVLDAGALTAFAGAADDLAGRIASAGGTAVLTPHEGEFHRLMDGTDAVTGGKLARAQTAAQLLGAVVILKGGDTVIAAPDGRAAVHMVDRPWLATAGTGDVLAGLVTAMLAEGSPAFEAAAMAVWLHGEAAGHAGPALTAEDLVGAIKPARALLAELAA